MATMDINTPRFFCDSVSSHLAKGSNTSSIITGTNLLDFQSGTISEISDGKPLNRVTFDTSSNTSKHILFNFDFATNRPVRRNFCAILNHNFNTSNARIRIAHSANSDRINDIDFSAINTGSDYSWASNTCTEILNADTIAQASDDKSCLITPGEDGSTIFTFPNTENFRYSGIQIEGATSFNGSTDVEFGCILLGTFYDMPHAPDVSLTRSILYDGVKVNQSIGGQKYGLATNIGKFIVPSSAGTAQYPPFILSTSNEMHEFMGRQVYDLSFSFINRADLIPDKYTTHSDVNAGDNNNLTQRPFVMDVWNQTLGNMLPFIFCIDKDATGDDVEGEYMYARFDTNELNMQQVSNKLYNVKMKIIEEF